jgi:UDP-N-acetylglucosamine acyltransferase
MVGVHQFCHIGAHSFIAGNTLVLKDVPAYVMASGQPAKPFGLNSEGLKRRGFNKSLILAIKRAYKVVYRQGLPLDEALAVISDMPEQSVELNAFSNSIKESTRGIIR